MKKYVVFGWLCCSVFDYTQFKWSYQHDHMWDSDSRGFVLVISALGPLAILMPAAISIGRLFPMQPPE